MRAAQTLDLNFLARLDAAGIWSDAVLLRSGRLDFEGYRLIVWIGHL